MTRKCDLTDKGVQSGHRVSKSKVRTKHRFLPNIQKRKFRSDENNKFVTLKVSTSAIRTIDKLGFDQYLRKLGKKI